MCITSITFIRRKYNPLQNYIYIFFKAIIDSFVRGFVSNNERGTCVTPRISTFGFFYLYSLQNMTSVTYKEYDPKLLSTGTMKDLVSRKKTLLHNGFC